MIDGKRVNDVPAKARNIAMVFQNYALYPHMSVYDNMAFGLKMQKIDKGIIDERVNWAAQILGLRDYLKRKPGALSGGQRQRVNIARALAVQPKFLVCDESVAALDVSIQAQVINLFMELRDKLDLTYLFVSHDLGVVEHISDRVAIMYLGRIVEEASVEEIFKRPNHPYTQALLSEIPRIEPGKHRFKPVEGELPSPLNPPKGCHFHPRCPFAMDRCRIEVPLKKEIAPGHLSACHLND